MDTATATPVATPATSQYIPVDQIHPSRHQVRKDFDAESLQGLAEAIKQEGLLQPIVVRRVNDSYELISGERRLRSTKLLGLTTIEAKVIQTVSEGEAAAKGLVENIQRKNLNPIEEAEGFQELNQLDGKYWTLEQIAKLKGKDKSYVSRSLGLLGLPQEVQEKLRARNFSRSHGIELSRLPKERQLEAAKKVEAEHLSWEQTRKLVDKMVAEGGEGGKTTPHPPLSPSRGEDGAVRGAEGGGVGGFKFKASGPDILISARIPRSADMEQELTKLKDQLLAWIASHPNGALEVEHPSSQGGVG